MTTLAKARRDFLATYEAAILAEARAGEVRRGIDARATRAAWRRYDRAERALARAVVKRAGLPAWAARL